MVGGVKRGLVVGVDYVSQGMYASRVEHMVDGELGQVLFRRKLLGVPLAVLAALGVEVV